ncbi:hypothetical protein H4R99_007130 [Coemansia sp. RSA 1722]|nr:hypothetical protein LPJ57_001678 [Coemansia sp. RSA 486]KAJ2224460.1 hypothetical protein IWW45_008084 [Coemansia sp. RSA 485]KAJ2590359.1 hypothetical protein H4R99_007130 [Coemansia sp. RSA 1722]
MPRKAVSSYFGGLSLLTNAGTPSFSSAPAKYSGSRERVSRLLNKVKSSIKSRCSRAVSKISIGAKKTAEVKYNNGLYLYNPPEFAAAEDSKNAMHPRFSCESDSTAVDQQHHSTDSKNLAAQSDVDVVKPAEPCSTDEISASYCAVLDGLVKEYRDTEDIYHPDVNGGVFWRTQNAYKARHATVEWMSRISGPTYADHKALHLGVCYFDQFLCEFGQPIESGLKNYALACLYLAKVIVEGTPKIKMALPTGDKAIPETEQSKQALQDVAQTLYWCTNMVKGVDGKTFVKTVDLPTAVNFLELAFQRAAIELPGQFAEEQRLLERPHSRQQGDFVREFAIRPFAKACRLANILLCDQDSLLFRWSELAAACFFIAAQPGSIESGVFLRCTGYTLESVEPAIVYARAVCQGF